jgi:hypothetical protein
LAWRGVAWCASVLVVDASPEGVDLITGSQVGSFISDLASSVFLGRAREILPMEMQLALFIVASSHRLHVFSPMSHVCLFDFPTPHLLLQVLLVSDAHIIGF